MNQSLKIPPDQSISGFIYDTKCNLSLCSISNVTNIVPTAEITASKKTYLERALGYVVIGIIGVVANVFVILILGSSSIIRQKLVNTLIIHQSFVDLLVSIVMIGTAHVDGSDQHGLDGFHADIYCFFITGKWPLWVMIDVSSFSLVFLNIERYISIVHPIYHHTNITRKTVLTLLPIVWLLGLLEQCFLSSSFKSRNGACDYRSPDMFEVTVITYLILHFFLPVMIVLFLYGHMILTLKSAVNSKMTPPGAKEMKSWKKLRRMFLKQCFSSQYATQYAIFSIAFLLLFS